MDGWTDKQDRWMDSWMKARWTEWWMDRQKDRQIESIGRQLDGSADRHGPIEHGQKSRQNRINRRRSVAVFYCTNRMLTMVFPWRRSRGCGEVICTSVCPAGTQTHHHNPIAWFTQSKARAKGSDVQGPRLITTTLEPGSHPVKRVRKKAM